jgi:hypothetical protein
VTEPCTFDQRLWVTADPPALAMAEAGKLAVYVRMDGTVGEVGRLKVGRLRPWPWPRARPQPTCSPRRARS